MILRDQANFYPRGSKYFAVVASLFVACLLISNIAAQKLIPIGPFIFTGGILLFPVTYIAGDVLTEIWGYARTRQVIWTGFVASGFMALFMQIIVMLPPAPGWENQDAFASVFHLVPRIVLGSIVGYWVGEFANSFVMAKMKIYTKGKHLWARTIGSTVVGQLLDTIVFVAIALTGVYPTPVLITAVWSGYLFKVLYEAAATPLTYAVVGWLKRAEGIDVYDHRTNFTPFSLKVPPDNQS